MPPIISAEICYLLLLPLQSALPHGKRQPLPVRKDTPYFFDLDIEVQPAGEERVEIDGTPVSVRYQVLDEQVWLAECRYPMANLLGSSAAKNKLAVQTALKEKFQRETGYRGAFIEEYSIILLAEPGSEPEEFINNHAAHIAHLLRSLDKPLTSSEVSEIIGARARFSQRDLTAIDWEGALIIAEKGDFQSDIELLKIGNYQLLRYRLLDRTIERSLQGLRANLHQTRLWRLPSPASTLQKIVEQRLSLLLDFEKIDQSLLLIGDWYSAQVYRLIVDEFYLDDWKAAVSAKLDNLAAMDEIVRQNLTFSWGRLLDLIQIIGWLILLVGYFILFFAELGWF